MSEETEAGIGSGDRADGAGAVPAPQQAAADGDTPAAQAAAPAPEGFAQAVELLGQGGPVVAVLVAMSVFALAIVLAKAVQFAGPALAGQGRARRAVGLFREGRVRAARDCVEGRRGLAPRIARDAIAGLAAGRAPELVREDALRRASVGLEGLRGWLRPLEVIAALAPLLGLFGTVLGMIEAFAALEAAGSRVDPAVLSGGIWEALLTTAVGLAVAIPAVAAVNWFERRVERADLAIESLISGLVTADPARPLEEARADDAAPRLAHAAE
jgi:biopolymer transport protein ExbB